MNQQMEHLFWRQIQNNADILNVEKKRVEHEITHKMKEVMPRLLKSPKQFDVDSKAQFNNVL